jgi:hypothetical protein
MGATVAVRVVVVLGVRAMTMEGVRARRMIVKRMKIVRGPYSSALIAAARRMVLYMCC